MKNGSSGVHSFNQYYLSILQYICTYTQVDEGIVFKKHTLTNLKDSWNNEINSEIQETLPRRKAALIFLRVKYLHHVF